jgi:hypothetical protein
VDYTVAESAHATEWDPVRLPVQVPLLFTADVSARRGPPP